MTSDELFTIISKIMDLLVVVAGILAITWRYNHNNSSISINDFVNELRDQIEKNKQLEIENARLKLEAKVWKKQHERAVKIKRT